MVIQIVRKVKTQSVYLRIRKFQNAFRQKEKQLINKRFKNARKRGITVRV